MGKTGEKQIEKKKGKIVLKFLKEMLIPLIIGVIVGVIIGIIMLILEKKSLFPYFFDKLQQIELSFIFFLLYLILANFININIHEFGHFVFGKISGYKLISYRFGIFSWNYENGKMKFSIQLNKGYSGLCAMLPPKNGISNKVNLLYYTGGIIFNLIFSVIFFIGFILLKGFFAGFFLFIAIIGFLIALFNLTPFFSGNIPTDGKIIWSLILKRPFADKLIEINQIISQLTAGIRPGELKISLPDTIEHPNSFALMTILYLYFKVLDNDELAKMQEYAKILEGNIDLFSKYHLPALYYELCFLASISAEQEKAKEYYKKAGKILEKDQDLNGLRVKAYFEYYVNKDHKKALAYANDALAVVDKFPIKGQAIMEEELVKKLIEKIKSQVNLA